ATLLRQGARLLVVPLLAVAGAAVQGVRHLLRAARSAWTAIAAPLARLARRTTRRVVAPVVAAAQHVRSAWPPARERLRELRRAARRSMRDTRLAVKRWARQLRTGGRRQAVRTLPPGGAASAMREPHDQEATGSR
ncbi:MAG: hypothetical protein ACRD12_09080, partial [Acidimicrobiales bacterium]